MTVPFMKAYTELLVQTAHQRGAFAMGGMSAFVPSRRDPAVNDRAFAAVRADKRREAEAGFDGTWVAHPDLVAIAQAEFDAVLGDRPNQIEKQRPDVQVTRHDLLDLSIVAENLTPQSVHNTIETVLHYLFHWLGGAGAVALNNLMEDAATAEISRTLLWLWRTQGVRLSDGEIVTDEFYKIARDSELQKAIFNDPENISRWNRAAHLLDRLVLGDTLKDFLTLDAYPDLNLLFPNT
jgi:malate synthase